MTQKEREIFDEWFESEIMRLVRLRAELCPSLDSFTFTDKTGDKRYECNVKLDVNITFKQENWKCKNCNYLKKVHKQEETEADTFICMEKLSVIPTEMLGSYSCCEFVWKQEE